MIDLVDSPEPFRVGMPQTFGQTVRQARAAGSDPEPDLGGQWLGVRGGPLPSEVVVRVDRTGDGRFIVTGLLMGLSERREITWETLRKIKPATILEWIFAGFDPGNPARLSAETNPLPTELVPGEAFDQEAWIRGDDDGPLIPTTRQQWRDSGRASAALVLWSAAVRGSFDPNDDAIVEPVMKPRASVAKDLLVFAETYLRHLATAPRRATAATAAELSISTATANRRIAECRAKGLLPPKGSSS